MQKNLESKLDEELMERYQMGDAAAFDILFQRHASRVLGFLSNRLRSNERSQDLLQDVFLKLHRSKHQYDRSFPFSPWLFSIARSVLLDALKKRQLEIAIDSRDLDTMRSTESAEESTSRDRAAGALKILPHAQQQAVRLRVYDEETFEAIALRLSTSPENARQLVSRGLKRLRKFLGVRKD